MTVSRTAQGVARARARMTRPVTSEGDPESEERLNRDLGADLDAAPGGALLMTAVPVPVPVEHVQVVESVR